MRRQQEQPASQYERHEEQSEILVGTIFSDRHIYICAVKANGMLPDHLQEVKLDFSRAATDDPTEVHPQELRQFGGDQLPISKQDYDQIMEEVKKDKANLLKDATETLGPGYEELIRKLDELYSKNLDSFRSELLGDGPIKGFKVIETPLKEGAEHRVIKHKTRVYTAEQMEFLSQLCKRFLEAGLIIKCGPQKTSSPVLVVRKPNGKGFRMVIDLRMANKLVEELAAPAVHLDMVRNCLSGSKLYGSFDLTDGYWQVAMDPVGRRLYSFQTHEGTFQMLRLPQGAKNSAAIFQSIMNEICGKYLYRKGTGCIPYLDDMLLYATGPDEMFELQQYILSQFREHNVKAKLSKSIIVARELPWIGLQISEYGIAQEQTRVDALLALKEPSTGADLARFLGALNWMKGWLGINYQKFVQPLLDIKRKATELAGSSKASKLNKVQLRDAGLWNDSKTAAWHACLKAIATETLTLAHPDYNRCHLHIFCDASDVAWGGVCTQTPKDQGHLPLWERSHEALGFCSGSFKNHQKSWSTFDQEAWALLASVEYFSAFFNSKQPFYLHTDHKNLVYIFKVENFTQKVQTKDRVTRWALQLAKHNFILEHIEGQRNILADILSRWRTTSERKVPLHSPCIAVIKDVICANNETPNDASKGSGKKKLPLALRSLQPFLQPGNKTLTAPQRRNPLAKTQQVITNDEYVDPLLHETAWDWDKARTQHGLTDSHAFLYPNEVTIRRIQNEFLAGNDLLGGEELDMIKAKSKKNNKYFKQLDKDIEVRYDDKSDLWLSRNATKWIPKRAVHLQVCICVLAHAGLVGHATPQDTLKRIRQHFSWINMEHDIIAFVKNCLHCVGSRTGGKIPRPLSSTIHGLYPNHVMRLDFVSMPLTEEGFKSLLVMKDDHSQYIWLVPSKFETSEAVATSLLDWASKSKMPIILAVDKGSHFINELLEQLKKHTGLVDILPTVASNKQTHGSAENMNAQVRKLFRSLCSERRLDTVEWPHVLPIVVHALNHRKSSLLGDIAPVELFTGQAPDEVFDAHIHKDGAQVSIEKAQLSQDLIRQLHELRLHLNSLHRKALVSAENRRSQSRDSVNKHRHAFDRFEIGDFVLRGVPEGSSISRNRNKLHRKWLGPYQIVYPRSSKVYICKDLLTGVLYEIHADYLQLYSSQDLHISGRVKQQITFDTIGQKAVKITDFKLINGKPLIRIKWRNVNSDKVEDMWHPLSLATQLWSLQKVLAQLANLKENEDANRFIEEWIEDNTEATLHPSIV